MALSTEAIVAIIALLVMCVPGGLFVWKRFGWRLRNQSGEVLPTVEQHGKSTTLSIVSPLLTEFQRCCLLIKVPHHHGLLAVQFIRGDTGILELNYR